MEKNTPKKLEVVVITVVVIMLFLTLPVFYSVVEVPTITIVFAAVIYVTMAALMVYYAVERFKEEQRGIGRCC